MIRCVIVDDEPRAVRALEITLERHCPDVEVVGTAGNIEDAYRLIVQEEPALAFLDINMPKGTGLDLLERLRNTEGTQVIFTTAHEEFAIKAFRLSAIDYLLKPIAKEELIVAVNRFKENQSETSRMRMTLLSELLSQSKTERIAISTMEGFHLIDLDQLYFLSSEKNYTHFHLANHKIMASKSIGEYEKWLDADQFLRVHRSYIINLDKVREYVRKKGGVILHSEEFIEVSKSKKQILLQKLKVL